VEIRRVADFTTLNADGDVKTASVPYVSPVVRVRSMSWKSIVREYYALAVPTTLTRSQVSVEEIYKV
jgi:hypothetical protein